MSPVPPIPARALSLARRGYDAAGPALGAVVGSVVGIDPPAGRVVLTFDDGPDPVATPAILEVLAAHHASATFFLLGSSVRRHPEIARAVADAGQEIALHGDDHRRTTDLDLGEFRSSLARGRRTVEEATGRTVRWFRPPYGGQNPATYAATRRAGLTPVMWTGTFWDWRDIPQDERVAKAVESTLPGGIALAHDRHADHTDGVDDGVSPELDRAELVDLVLTAWEQRGLRAVGVGPALDAGARLVRRPWFPRQAPIHHNAG